MTLVMQDPICSVERAEGNVEQRDFKPDLLI